MEYEKRIKTVFSKVLPQVDYENCDSLVDDGILDSLSIVILLSELTLEFGVFFDIAELAPDNLNSVQAIADTIKVLVKEQNVNRTDENT